MSNASLETESPVFTPELPEVPWTGFVTSRWQEGPGFKLIDGRPTPTDIWDEYLVSGVNKAVRSAIEKAEGKRSIEGVEQRIYNSFERELDRDIDHLEGVAEGRIHELYLDFDLVENYMLPALSGEMLAGAFSYNDTGLSISYFTGQALNSAIGRLALKAFEHDMRIKIIVNQYAGIDEDTPQEPDFSERLKESQLRLGAVLADIPALGLEVSGETINDGVELVDRESKNARVKIEPMPVRDYEYWKEYIDEIVERGGNTFRFSAEWSRVMSWVENSERLEGWGQVIDEDEYKLLRDVIAYARGKDVRVMMAMHHFTLPNWLIDERGKEGWVSPRAAGWYTDFSLQLLDRLAEEDLLPEDLITTNEPLAWLPTGYLDGSWPPHKKGRVDELIKASTHSLDAHVQAYEKIKSRPYGDRVRVGFSENFPVFGPYYKWLPVDHVISRTLEKINHNWVWRLLRRSKNSGRFLFDFFGLQFYNKYHVGLLRSNLGANQGAIETPEWMSPLYNGWLREPEGLAAQLMLVEKMLLDTATDMGTSEVPPIYIPETGLPSPTSPKGELVKLFEAVNYAQKFIRPVLMLLVWTLRDNREWISSVGRFGMTNGDGSAKPNPVTPAKPLDLENWSIRSQLKQLRKAQEKHRSAVREP